jgi:hypothetical protein
MAFPIPPEIEAQYAGRWVAWDLDTSQFLGAGATLREVDALARPALEAGHVVHTQYLWPGDVKDRQAHWQTLPESADPAWDTHIPPDLERQYVGQVIAWDLVARQVAGHGETIDEASNTAQAARRAGHPLYYRYVFPANAVLLGGLDLAFRNHADGRPPTADHPGADRSA